VLRFAGFRTKPNFLDRRHERVTVIDAQSALREVEVHVRVTPSMTNVTEFPPWRDGRLLVPIARLARFDAQRILVHTPYDLRDENGARVPRLTTRQERGVVTSGIWYHAASAVGGTLTEPVAERLRRIIFRGSSPQSLTLPLPDGTPSQQAVALWGNATFREILIDAHRFFYLLVPVERAEPNRRVFTFSYSDNPRFDVDLTRKLTKRLLTPAPGVIVTCEAPGAADCDSYHFELFAPDETFIASAELAIHRTGAPKDEDDVALNESVSDRSAHCFWTGFGPLDTSNFRAELAPKTTATTWALRGVTLVTGMLLVTGCALSWSLSASNTDSFDRSALATLLLVAPGVITTVLAVHSHHPLTSKMLYGQRATAICANVALYLAALSLIAKPAPIWLVRGAWTLGVLVGLLCLLRTVNEMLWIGKVRSRGSIVDTTSKKAERSMTPREKAPEAEGTTDSVENS
jgi:hypothetical protein